MNRMYERGDRPVVSGEVSAEHVFGEKDDVPALMSPIDWWKLDRCSRGEVLQVLGRFVPELVRRFVLSDAVVPPCWYRHEPLIQELLGLFQLRQQTQFLDSAPASAPNDFHVQLALWMQRMRSFVAQTGCNAAEHREPQLASWAIPGNVPAAVWRTDFDFFTTERLKGGWPEWSPLTVSEGENDE